MITLYPYQNDAVSLLREGFRKHTRQILASPTGSGKTVMFSEIVRLTAANNKRVLVLTDRQELFTQIRSALERIQVMPVLINASTNTKKGNPWSQHDLVFVGMVETLKRREYLLADINPDLIILDECHKAAFTRILDMFPDTKTIGATATPIGKHIPKYFTNIVQNIDVQDLIAQGFLVRCRAYQMQDDFSDLVARAGEFTEESQMDHFDKKTLYDGVIREWLTKNPEPTSWAKTICFNVNIAHTEKMHDAWLQEGIPSGIITSKTSKQDRIQVLQDFKDGKITVLNNCGVLTTGFDEPSIQCVIVNRATMSLALWLQMVGRGSRTFPNKTEFLLLDFGMNHKRHGLWSQPRKWSLDMKERKVSDKLDAAPVKTCDNCGAMVPIMAKECEFCLNVFDMVNKRLRNGVLVEVLPNPIEGKLLSQLTLEEISDLQDLKKLGFGAPYLWRVVRSRGAADILLYGRLRKYSSGWTGRQIEQMSDCAYKDKVVILPED